jgi:hypothetical protein
VLTGIIISGAVALILLAALLYDAMTKTLTKRERDLFYERERTRARLRRCLTVESSPAHAIRDPYLRDWPRMANTETQKEDR